MFDVISFVTEPNDSVHRAAANDFPFRDRVARGSECNGLFAKASIILQGFSKKPICNCSFKLSFEVTIPKCMNPNQERMRL